MLLQIQQKVLILVTICSFFRSVDLICLVFCFFYGNIFLNFSGTNFGCPTNNRLLARLLKDNQNVFIFKLCSSSAIGYIRGHKKLVPCHKFSSIQGIRNLITYLIPKYICYCRLLHRMYREIIIVFVSQGSAVRCSKSLELYLSQNMLDITTPFTP